jgi:hypothetical protein
MARSGKITAVETGTEGSAGQANLQGRDPADVPVSAHLPAGRRAGSPSAGGPGAGRRTSYGQNVTAFEQDHPGWRLSAGDGGFGYAARRRVHGGSQALTGRTLDELAVVLADADRRPGRDR